MGELQALSDLLGKKRSYQDIYSQFRTGTEQNPQKEAMNVVTAAPLVQEAPPVITDRGGAIKRPVPRFTKENINQVLSDELDIAAKKRQREADAINKFEQAYSQYGSNIPDLAAKPPVDVELQNQKRAIQNKLIDQKDPERSMWAEAILSLGPSVLAGLTGGTAAMAAAKPATEGARSIYEGIRKQDIESNKRKIDNLHAQLKSLQDLEKRNQDDFYKDQNNLFRMVQLKTTMEANKLNARGKDKAQAEKDVNELNKMIAEHAKQSIFKIGDQQQKERSMDISAEAAKNHAPSNRPPSHSERKAAADWGRAQKAEGELKALGAETKSYPAVGDALFSVKLEKLGSSGFIPAIVNAMVKDDRTKGAIQAEWDWGLTYLRDASGAAIPESEIPRELNKYFPRYGDGEATIKAKSSSRKQLEEGLKIKAGRAELPKVEAPQKREQKKEKSGTRADKINQIKNLLKE